MPTKAFEKSISEFGISFGPANNRIQKSVKIPSTKIDSGVQYQSAINDFLKIPKHERPSEKFISQVYLAACNGGCVAHAFYSGGSERAISFVVTVGDELFYFEPIFETAIKKEINQRIKNLLSN